jgi:hypothetical protein
VNAPPNRTERPARLCTCLSPARIIQNPGSFHLDAVRDRLREDLEDDGEELVSLNAKANPVLASLWDNDKDAAYDRL